MPVPPPNLEGAIPGPTADSPGINKLRIAGNSLSILFGARFGVTAPFR